MTKNKKILYIDYLSPNGHVSFNSIYLNELLNLDVKITCVFIKGYSNNFEKKIIDNITLVEIPEDLCSLKNNPLNSRINYFKALQFIKSNLNLSNFDHIIFSSYEEISFFFSGISDHCFLINHNNIRSLNNIIKRIIFKNISKNNTQIVFDNTTKDYLHSFGISNVITINHGLPNKINFDFTNSELKLDDVNLKNYTSIIFIPSSNNADKKLINYIVTDSIVSDFLCQKKILIILKSNDLFDTSINIKLINYKLSKEMYNTIFYLSKIILLPYPDSFKYRSSNILFESISNNKLFLTNNAFLYNSYSKFLNYEPYFTKDTFFKKITELLDFDSKSIYKNTKKLSPNFNFLMFKT